jgi:hypothetical protein
MPAGAMSSKPSRKPVTSGRSWSSIPAVTGSCVTSVIWLTPDTTWSRGYAKCQADCVKHYGGALNDAGTARTAIGVGLIIAFWMMVDVILGVSYRVYSLARRTA